MSEKTIRVALERRADSYSAMSYYRDSFLKSLRKRLESFANVELTYVRMRDRSTSVYFIYDIIITNKQAFNLEKLYSDSLIIDTINRLSRNYYDNEEKLNSNDFVDITSLLPS